MPLLNAQGMKPGAGDLLTGEVLDILRGAECQACGNYKRSGMSHCGDCYGRLPEAMKKSLWQRVGEGYEEAYRRSLAWLVEAVSSER